MSGFLIFNYEILDSVRVEELRPQSLPMLLIHGGEIIIASHVTQPEGSRFTYVLVYRFATQNVAMVTTSLERYRSYQNYDRK